MKVSLKKHTFSQTIAEKMQILSTDHLKKKNQKVVKQVLFSSKDFKKSTIFI